MRISELEPTSVFGYFEELTKIPRGSGDMEKVSSYCVEFAKKHGLFCVRDEHNNVIIKKPASKGYEQKEPIILQGHLDMVCQKDAGVDIDFLKDGMDAFVDGDYISARGTTLGADNGIAVAMVLSILADNSISHPPIEAVFTTDEEIGMIGASGLSMEHLSGKRMINLDSEDPSVVTVSCAGGSDFKIRVPLAFQTVQKSGITISIKGLLGGHSGVEINKGRVNANLLLGRVLNHLRKSISFDIIGLNGGDKGNAIPNSAEAFIAAEDVGAVKKELSAYSEILSKELSSREPSFSLEFEKIAGDTFEVISDENKETLISMLVCAPSGVLTMSAEIENLVETSLNLGVLKMERREVTLLFALRSNKESALLALSENLTAFSKLFPCTYEAGGFYPPWEYNENSKLQVLYQEKYKEKFGVTPETYAIHAGLECGVFASKIKGFDCISVGPEMHDIHTTNERLSISSSKALYELILEILKHLK